MKLVLLIFIYIDDLNSCVFYIHLMVLMLFIILVFMDIIFVIIKSLLKYI